MNSLLGSLLVLVYFSMSFSQMLPPKSCDPNGPPNQCPSGHSCSPIKHKHSIYKGFCSPLKNQKDRYCHPKGPKNQCPPGDGCLPTVNDPHKGLCVPLINRKALNREPPRECVPYTLPSRCYANEYCAESSMPQYNGFCIERPEGMDD